MLNAATKIDRDSATERVGWVIRVQQGKGALGISLDGGTIEAKRAMSCMLDPAVGDRVLVALIGDGSAYVLAVLEREAVEKFSASWDELVETVEGQMARVR